MLAVLQLAALAQFLFEHYKGASASTSVFCDYVPLRILCHFPCPFAAELNGAIVVDAVHNSFANYWQKFETMARPPRCEEEVLLFWMISHYEIAGWPGIPKISQNPQCSI